MIFSVLYNRNKMMLMLKETSIFVIISIRTLNRIGSAASFQVCIPEVCQKYTTLPFSFENISY